MEVIASSLLANGLRTEFADTYSTIRNRQADGRLGIVMDLSISSTTREPQFGYFEAAPHMTYWKRGNTIPTDAMGSVSFSVPIYEWARRIKWSKWDRKDEQTKSLFDMARMVGESAALLPERFFFDLLNGVMSTLPAVPNAPDGASFFSTTDGNGQNRFGVADGNLLTGNGVTSASDIKTDYYNALEQFKLFQDGKGQPLFSDEIIDAGVLIIFGAANTEVFEEAFLQRRQGEIISGAGTTPSNVIIDASRTVRLWGTSRITNNDWYVFLLNPPKKPTFLVDREGLQEFTSLEGDNNSDYTRDTGEEYIQWELRQGAGIALPYAAIKINN